MAVVEEGQSIAIVNGAPIGQLPEDLYIPPDALEVFLALFEGPLDLLLYLIKRQNLDILTIPIAEITHQYMIYIELMGNLNIELAADYLVMAAWLAEIKSRLLLPRQTEAEDEEEDPRAVLIRRLQEYEVIKNAAEHLDDMPRCERDIFTAKAYPPDMTLVRQYPELDLNDLIKAFSEVLKRIDQLSHHHISKEPLSIRERMATILAKLEGQDSLLFSHCFSRKEGRRGVVITFLAILELGKERLIEIFQSDAFADIHVRAIASGDTAAASTN